MGGRSSQSEDIITQTSTETDNSYMGSGGQGLARDATISRSTIGDVGSNNTYNYTDNGATAAAIEYSEQIANDAIYQVSANASELGKLSTDLGSEALSLAGDFVAGGNNLNEAYLDSSERGNTQVKDTVFAAGAAVIDFAGNETQATRDLAYDAAAATGAAFSEANERIAESSRDAIRAAENANQSILTLARDTSGDLARAYDRNSANITDFAFQTLGTYENLFSQSQESVNEANYQAQKASEKSLDYVFQSTKDATERNTDNYIKYATLGAVGIAGFMALSLFARR